MLKDEDEECKRLGLDTTGCQDKEDLIRLLRSGSSGPSFDPRGAPKPPPPAAPRPPPVTPTRVTPATTGATGATVWDRQRVPPRFTVHKRYEAMYLLGLDTNRLPSGAELRAAYRKAAMESHPETWRAWRKVAVVAWVLPDFPIKKVASWDFNRI
eukprot:s628_g6.t1